MDLHLLLEELPVDRRLALAYAPAHARAATLAVMVLDLRLARLLTHRREPLLTQMRLAWWRDRLSEPTAGFHHDEPVLELLGAWGNRRADLTPLVDGWEALLADPPIMEGAIRSFAKGRGAAFAALAGQLGHDQCSAEAHRCGQNWAMADLGIRTSDPEEAERIRALVREQDWRAPRLPRSLRPLAVLHGLARRKKGAEEPIAGLADIFSAARLGIFGQ